MDLFQFLLGLWHYREDMVYLSPAPLYHSAPQAAVGLTQDDLKFGENAGVYIGSVIANILVAGMMRHTFAMAGIDGFGKGLISGLGIGLFFISPWIMINNAYGDRPFKLTVIDSGYAAFGYGVMGAILGLF